MKTPRYPIMVVDDIRTNLLFISSCLKKASYTNMIQCQDSSRVLELLSAHSVELLLLDLRMPEPDGITLLPMIRSEFPDLPVIIVTDISDVETAVQCMRDGAFDYVTKPIDQEMFRITIDRALSFRNLQRENSDLKKTAWTVEDLENPEVFSGIITRAPEMFRVFSHMEAIAETSEPVLITGETGVGKELVAQVLHRLSRRRGELVAVNVAGLDDSVFSDTLFGHIPGAFTGADKIRQGLIETASEGTLFLDEIGDLTPASQVKLLRLLQENEYMPLGMDTVKKSSARIIVATNEELFEIQKKGQFRKDLIYRLKTHHIHIPPLRERKSDIPALLDYFLDKAISKTGKNRPGVSRAVLSRLESYSFPGNIRELQAIVFDAVSRNNSQDLSVENFKDYFKTNAVDQNGSGVLTASDSIIFPETLPTIKDATDMLVKEAMKRASGKQVMAAEMLGISQPALNKRLKKMEEGL